jgi:DNA-binding NarL/FixJ family response regulator
MKSVRILLVGNNTSFLNLLTRFLEQADDITVVGVFRDTRQDLAQARRLRPHIIVTDLGTPGLTGLGVISYCHTHLPETNLIVTSLLRAGGYRNVALAAGADEVIPQVRLTTDLLPTIRRIVKKKHSLSRTGQKKSKLDFE